MSANRWNLHLFLVRSAEQETRADHALCDRNGRMPAVIETTRAHINPVG